MLNVTSNQHSINKNDSYREQIGRPRVRSTLEVSYR